MDYTTEAKLWVEQHPHYELLSSDLDEHKITFQHQHHNCGCQNFYIIYPSSETQWHLWSDSSKTVELISVITQSLDRASTMTDILERVHSVLNTQPSSSRDRTEEDIEEDDNLDNDDDDDDLDDDDDDLDDDDGFYYDDSDHDDLEATEKKSDDDEDDEALKYFTKGASTTAIARLLKDHKNLSKSDGNFGVVGHPAGDNLFVWDVKLTDFCPKSRLGKDLGEFAKKYEREPVVYLKMVFPGEYPMMPPFVRIVRPRFKFMTGHVTLGGSICMEMLTKSGWTPTNDIESILVQIRSEIMSDANASLDPMPDRAYDETEAKTAFQRMVRKYGWDK